jgi:hypothetical protein
MNVKLNNLSRYFGRQLCLPGSTSQ